MEHNKSHIIAQDIIHSIEPGRFKNVDRFIAFNLFDDAITKGKIVKEGYINDNVEVFGIITDSRVKFGTNGTFKDKCIFNCKNECGVLVKRTIKLLDLNGDGSVKLMSNKDMFIKSGKYSMGDYVCVKFNKIIGQITHVGEINGILCYEVKMRKDSNSYKSSVIVIENDIMDNEVIDPTKYSIHTYFKKGAYVTINGNNCGVVKKYIFLDKIMYYIVETDAEYLSVRLADAVYGVDLEFKNSFFTVEDPSKYGIISTLKKGSTVQIRGSTGISHGHISWMGFDRQNSFKFGLTLEERDGTDDGTYYGQTLFTTKKGYAALVFSADVIPDERFPQEEEKRTQPKISSETVDKYTIPPYRIPLGDHKGIQGNLNSCYLDTSIFAIFAYNVFLDNIVLEDLKGDLKELQDILKKNLVYPLRKNFFVSYDKVMNFRNKLQELSPTGKFTMNERDPEELLETLFHLLTPKLFLLRTKPFHDVFEQKCFMTQLFYQHVPVNRELNILEMLTLTFLESQMWISKPPKGLIIQLPRHGRELKVFKTVKILPKIDITPFIVLCAKTCKNCSKKEGIMHMCTDCSMKDYKLTYYCDEHKEECAHDNKIKLTSSDNNHSGNVELELIAILCIERTHYVAYAKTNEVSEKWVYFNSMEKLDDGEFIPHIRETLLHLYFNDPNIGKQRNDPLLKSDIEKIENFAFVCFYKNPAMEFYSQDFNSD